MSACKQIRLVVKDTAIPIVTNLAKQKILSLSKELVPSAVTIYTIWHIFNKTLWIKIAAESIEWPCKVWNITLHKDPGGGHRNWTDTNNTVCLAVKKIQVGV